MANRESFQYLHSPSGPNGIETTTKADEKETIKNLTNLTTGNLITFLGLCYPKNLSKCFGKMSLGKRKRNEKLCWHISTIFISVVLYRFVKNLLMTRGQSKPLHLAPSPSFHYFTPLYFPQYTTFPAFKVELCSMNGYTYIHVFICNCIRHMTVQKIKPVKNKKEMLTKFIGLAKSTITRYTHTHNFYSPEKW